MVCYVKPYFAMNIGHKANKKSCELVMLHDPCTKYFLLFLY